ncbi:DUF2953 domain-containing protein [Clostridium saccharobutylicum]|uniref:DUF2953 domain-containing protein n=1 Tax=Clostridium saccharobutylicum TaxID=169679 RepID=A0A1S8MY87_CLOSA|nr:DUF2953 domain-containing protein [Clostridium saccharobutylicum]OOM09134.1 hypothetical protein CLOSAC_34140 [Clostridium saccharobutylicum]
MKLFLIIFIIFLIFFMPIPLKITAYCTTNDYYIKLYNFTIFSKKNKKEIVKEKTSYDKKVKTIFSKYNFKNINYKSLIKKLYNSKFKPFLRISFKLDYSLSDAAKTGFFYGILHQLPPLIYILINIPFKSTKFKYDINPIFEDNLLLKFETSSIFFFSIANIIYVLFILFKFIIKTREVPPLK